MSWNYRVFVSKHKGEINYEIREAYYRKGGKLEMFTTQEVGVHSDSLAGIREVLAMMLMDTYRAPPVHLTSKGGWLKRKTDDMPPKR